VEVGLCGKSAVFNEIRGPYKHDMAKDSHKGTDDMLPRKRSRIPFAGVILAATLSGLQLNVIAAGPVNRPGLNVTVKQTTAGTAKLIDSKRIRVNPSLSADQFVLRVSLNDEALMSEPVTFSATLGGSDIAGRLSAPVIESIAGRLDAEVRVKLISSDGNHGDKKDLVLRVTTKIPDNQNPAAKKDVYYEDRVQIVIDSQGPSIDGDVGGERSAFDSISVQFKLKETDLDGDFLQKSTFKVYFNTNTSGAELVTSSPIWNAATRTIQLDVQGRGLGNYILNIPTDALRDNVGNLSGSIADKTFQIKDGPTLPRKGTHVEFPEFLSRDTRDIRDFNAFDRVTTRVIRLYYERDAYKVVKTINRNVEELNRSGASFAQDLANKIQDQADTATTVRRTQEQQAIQEVQRAREARKGIERAEQQRQRSEAALTGLRAKQTAAGKSGGSKNLNELATLVSAAQGTVDEDTKSLKLANDALSKDAGNQALKDNVTAAEKKLSDDRANLATLTERRNAEIDREATLQELSEQVEIASDNLGAAKAQIQSYNSQLADSQQKESVNAIGVLNAQASEDQLRAKQFRQEVVAGLTDRDIYAAASTTSRDPVTQVSMSVIGEGAIHLRGPAKGINKIARMIHQMDTPVGQVKLGIQTVQINGEHGDRMEFVYERIDKHIAQARFLTHESTQLFRKAVQEVASEIALQIDQNYIPPDMPEFDNECAALTGADQYHWRYVNAFFGGDFIRELRQMDSELLKHNNKLLSLHSMDTMSLAGALYVTAIAKHSVRQSIIERFKGMVLSELPSKEVDYYRALTRIRCSEPHINHLIVAHFGQKLDAKDAQMIWEKAIRTYQFSNFVGFFDAQLAGEDTLNNVQYATLRLAQALKAQLVSELELRNLVLERSLIEMRPDENLDILNASKREFEAARERIETEQEVLNETRNKVFLYITSNLGQILTDAPSNSSFCLEAYKRAVRGIQNDRSNVIDYVISTMQTAGSVSDPFPLAQRIIHGIHEKFITPKLAPLDLTLDHPDIVSLHQQVNDAAVAQICAKFEDICNVVQQERALSRSLAAFRRKAEAGEKGYEEARKKNAAIRVLDAAIDETEEKAVELLEAMRSHVANVDNYLKRLSISFEDDVNAQFYNPAMMDVRRASRYWDVNLSQVENTTVLTNNRALAKVSPNATMEFDLPARDILLVEALKGSKALAQEYGNLLKDPTFIAGVGLVGGRVPTGLGQAQSPIQGIPDPTMGLGQQPPQVGAALTQLIPEPAVYKFETGTALEVRPVIQPDGHSIVYRFDYMYTTNVREPVRADEKHLGRVKRHFTSTDVQTSSYEMREITRYSVALKASRTSRGVPLLEDIPALGWVFRPLPNQESSLQQNIILGTSTIYPTLFDLMGLRWSPYADQIDSRDLASRKKREREITRRYRSNLLNKARAFVREELGGDLELPPDLPGDYIEPDPVSEQIPNGPISNRYLRERNDAGGQGPVEEEIPLGRPQGPQLGPQTSSSRRTPVNASIPRRIASDPRETGRGKSPANQASPPQRRPVGKASPLPSATIPEDLPMPTLTPPGASRTKRPSLIQQASYTEPADEQDAGYSNMTMSTNSTEASRQSKEVAEIKPIVVKTKDKPSGWQRLFRR
jgi:hypothetical protein